MYPHKFEKLDPDPHFLLRILIQEGKNDTKIEKVKKFMFGSAGCSLWRRHPL
jgi:hypothetical protein